MKITTMETIPVSVPLRTFMGGSYYTGVHNLEYVLVRLTTDEGLTGLGEAGSMGPWGETQRMAMATLHELRPAIVGSDPFEIERVHERMAALVKDHPISKCAVDMALHDIVGKAAGVPVHMLLGGRYRRSMPIHCSIGIKDVKPAIEEAQNYLKIGVRHLKVKVGRDPKRDIEVVKQVRALIAKDALLMVDANQGYETVHSALDTIWKMEAYGPLLIEQPIAGTDLDGLAEIRRRIASPVMADEALWTPEDCLRIVEKRAADAVQVYLQKSAGFARAQKSVHIAEAARLIAVIGGMTDLGIASAAELHISAAMRNVRPDIIAAGISGPGIIADDVIQVPFTIKDGGVDVPEGPGLGIELDEGKVKKYRVDL